MTYPFGDTELAARRLELLAVAFAQSSRTFTNEAADTGLRLAGDLGCTQRPRAL